MQENQLETLPYHAVGDPFAENAPAPLIFLHGLGADRQNWINIQSAFARHHPSLAFDLPGHGKALDHPLDGSSGGSAKAVLRSLLNLGLAQKFHLIGHSMGGAISTLIALKQPNRVASLTLLAPGGFGPEINQPLLRSYVLEKDKELMADILRKFVGADYRMPKFLPQSAALARTLPGAADKLSLILDRFMDGTNQRTLDTKGLADAPFPIRIVWGMEDQVIPVQQTQNLPANMKIVLLEDVGHMPHLERPDVTVAEIRANLQID